MSDSLLTPLQKEVLYRFFGKKGGEFGFFLTGGTALAEFYLRHRYSDDLDLFTRMDEVLPEGDRILTRVAGELNLKWELVNRGNRSRQYQITPEGDESPLKVDLVQDIEAFVEPPKNFGGIRVDSLLDIAVNKVDCIFSRSTEVKDYVDLYFLLNETDCTLDGLMALVRTKQGGFDSLVLAAQLSDVGQFTFLPRMTKSVTLKELSDFFLEKSQELFKRLRPGK